MEEEEKPDEGKPQEPREPVAPASSDKPINSIDRANEAIDKMKIENDRTEALLERQEALRAEEIVSGKADAGQAPVKPKEETDAEYNARILRGDLNEKEKAEFDS